MLWRSLRLSLYQQGSLSKFLPRYVTPSLFFHFTSVLFIEISLLVKLNITSLCYHSTCAFGNKWYAFLFTHSINPFLWLNENLNAVYLFNEVYLDLGLRQPWLEGEEYLTVVDEFMEATQLFEASVLIIVTFFYY